MMHQRNKARSMVRKHMPSSSVPDLPSVPDMGSLSKSTPLPGGFSNAQQVLQGDGVPEPQAFKAGGRVK